MFLNSKYYIFILKDEINMDINTANDDYILNGIFYKSNIF